MFENMPNISEIYFYYVGECEPNNFIECRIAYWLWRTVPFILLAIGTFGNVVNIIILSRQKLRTFSTGVYLLILAISELTFLWTGLLPDTIYSITTFRLIDQSEVICRTRWWIALTSATLSVWILVLLTIERTLLTKAPVFSRNKMTPRFALISSLIVLVLVGLINGHMIYGFSIYTSTADKTVDDNIGENQLNASAFPCDFISSEYKYFYVHIWAVIMFILYTLLPSIIIILGNINIAAVILLQRKRQAKVAPGNPAKEAIANRKKSSARMLFILSFFFMLSTMPYCIYFVVRSQVKYISDRNVAKWQLLTVIVNILGWCNFTFNFFFYFVNGTLFKQEWKRLVSKTKESCQRFVTRGTDR